MNEECDKTSHISKVGRQQKVEFSEDEINILSRRCGMTSDQQFTDICLHHSEVYLQRYTRNQKKCSDPYSTHKAGVKSAPHEITLPLSMEGEKQGLRLIPGQKLCRRCNQKVIDSLQQTDANQNVESAKDNDTDENFVPDKLPAVFLDFLRQQL